MAAVTRKRDERRRQSVFIETMTNVMARTSLPTLRRRGMSTVTDVHSRLYAAGGPAYRTYDSLAGVLVVTAYSDLPQHRVKAARILGREVGLVAATATGTVYQAKVGL